MNKAVLTGYWQTWDLMGRATLPLIGVPEGYSEVIAAFIAPDKDGVLRFTGPNIPSREEIDFLRERGQKVLVSIGGGGVTVEITSSEQARRFSESLYELMNVFSFDGIDIDIEDGMPAIESPLELSGTQSGLILALESILAELPETLLTMAPETISLVGGMVQYGGSWGNYLPLIMHFKDRLTRVHMQYYNSGQMPGLSGELYEAGTIDFVTALTDAIIKGFEIAGTGVQFEGLNPSQVSIGLPATPEAALNGYLTPREINIMIRMLRTGRRGLYVPPAEAYPDIGGIMAWSVQWDESVCFRFMRGARSSLNI